MKFFINFSAFVMLAGVLSITSCGGTTAPETGAGTPAGGSTWSARTLPSSHTWQSVAYGNGVFVAIANGSTSAVSFDGITWTARTLPSSAAWCSVTYGDGVFVAIAANSTKAATSTDAGATWIARTLPSSAQWWSVTYGNGVFAAVARNSSIAATSSDGITWTAQTLSSSGS